MKLQAVTMALLQRVTLHSRKRPEYVEQCPEERYEFLNLRGPELDSQVIHTKALCRPQPYLEDDGVQVEWITRLPTDHEARPTTLAGGDAHIKLSHNLEFVILYDIDGDQPVKDAQGNAMRMRYRVTWPVTLVSCALRWRSLVLPEVSSLRYHARMQRISYRHVPPPSPRPSTLQSTQHQCPKWIETLTLQKTSTRTNHPASAANH